MRNQIIKIFLISLLVLLPTSRAADTVDTLAAAKTSRESTANTNKKSFSKTKFETAVAGCYSALNLEINDANTSLLDADKDTLAQEANQFYACTTSGTRSNSSKIGPISVDSTNTDNQSFVNQTGFCKFYDDIDGSDYLKVYYAAKQCYALEQTNGSVSGFALEDTGIFTECGKLNLTSGGTEATNFETCMADALFYLLPYTERQFFLCEEQCVTDTAGVPLSIVNQEPDFTDATNDTKYADCQKYRAACARFKIIVGGDQTNANYASYYEQCYEVANDGCWFETWDNNSNGLITDYFTCVASCDRPDYSYASTAGSTYLQPVLLAIAFVVMSLI